MSLKYDMHLNFGALRARVDAATPGALAAGIDYLHRHTTPKVPVETGRLVGSGKTHVEGSEASLTYDGPYAAVQHERTDFRHPRGGQAKYAEETWIVDGARAVEIMGEHIGAVL